MARPGGYEGRSGRTMMIDWNKKTARQKRLYHELFDIYEEKGSLEAWNFAFDLVKLRELREWEANALMEEISACFSIG